MLVNGQKWLVKAPTKRMKSDLLWVTRWLTTIVVIEFWDCIMCAFVLDTVPSWSCHFAWTIVQWPAVEHILNPILRTLDALAELRSKDATLAKWIDGRFGSAKALKVAILADFFKYAFDGSGADNFFDAGSCIDGRLTSAWHWCSQLPSKPFYIAFKLAGFTSFDGQFQT